MSRTNLRHALHPFADAIRLAVSFSATHSVTGRYLLVSFFGIVSHPAHSHTSPGFGGGVPRSTGIIAFTGCGPTCDMNCAQIRLLPRCFRRCVPPSTTRVHFGAPPPGLRIRACLFTSASADSVRNARMNPARNTNRIRGQRNDHPQQTRAHQTTTPASQGQASAAAGMANPTAIPATKIIAKIESVLITHLFSDRSICIIV